MKLGYPCSIFEATLSPSAAMCVIEQARSQGWRIAGSVLLFRVFIEQNEVEVNKNESNLFNALIFSMLLL